MPLSANLTEERISPDAPFLTDLQGNILKGHGRDHTLSVFFHFNAGQQVKAKAWLASFTKRFVPSASKQLADTKRYKDEALPGGLFTNVFLTNKCYEYLAIPEAKRPEDGTFKAGMAGSNKSLKTSIPGLDLPLNDPPVSQWEKGFDGLIHVMVLIADDNPYFVRAMKRAVILSLTGVATIMKEQAGRGIRNKDGNGIEHNGYADGVSQPLFFEQDIKEELKHGIGHDHWQPDAPLKLALVRDKGGKTPDSCGSYLVFRKLEQNVKAFKDKEKELASTLFGSGHSKAQQELAGAMVVGRYENGTPLALDGVEKPIAKDKVPNDYSFETPNNDSADSAGLRCPFHAHTRKNNPRTDGFAPPGTTPVAANKEHRIVRRGIPYEDKPRKRLKDGILDGDVQPTGDVGLLFMCFQRDILNQFEFIQRVWANNEGFEHDKVGIGPIVGDTAPGTTPIKQQWPVGYQNPVKKPFLFSDVTKMKGGEYFFAPSLSFLTSLSTATVVAPSLQIFDKLDAFLIS